MKVKRKDWQALHARIAELEFQVRQARDDTLMQVRTGPVLLKVVVPMILNHLNVESRHGLGMLVPIDDSSSVGKSGSQT